MSDVSASRIMGLIGACCDGDVVEALQAGRELLGIFEGLLGEVAKLRAENSNLSEALAKATTEKDEDPDPAEERHCHECGYKGSSPPGHYKGCTWAPGAPKKAELEPEVTETERQSRIAAGYCAECGSEQRNSRDHYADCSKGRR